MCTSFTKGMSCCPPRWYASIFTCKTFPHRITKNTYRVFVFATSGTFRFVILQHKLLQYKTSGKIGRFSAGSKTVPLFPLPLLSSLLSPVFRVFWRQASWTPLWPFMHTINIQSQWSSFHMTNMASNRDACTQYYDYPLQWRLVPIVSIMLMQHHPARALLLRHGAVVSERY